MHLGAKTLCPIWVKITNMDEFCEFLGANYDTLAVQIKLVLRNKNNVI
jgi:hypothetical protein